MVDFVRVRRGPEPSTDHHLIRKKDAGQFCTLISIRTQSVRPSIPTFSFDSIPREAGDTESEWTTFNGSGSYTELAIRGDGIH